ncbi:MAG: signal peptidase [Verrucomicrobiota bacterium]|jgi:signal peptidase II
MRYIFFLSLPLYVLDQVSKYVVRQLVPPEQAHSMVAGFFAVVNVTNTGAAFGSFKNNNGFFVIVSCLALLVVVTLLVRHHSRDAWRDVSLALLLAGIVGNLTDRLLYGHVFDFLLFDLHVPLAHPWPAFNVADSCICIAVVFFIIHSLRPRKTAAKTPA